MENQNQTKPNNDNVMSGEVVRVMSQFITEEQFCTWLNVSRRTVQRWGAMRSGPRRTKVGDRTYYKVSTIEAWLNEQEEQATRTKRRA